ncbi:MAG: hypothetical protein HC827_10010 [Cyanobacteria bacterium RM1_2_2]|nr:hypothetical protein [Cyanobacteria bacterium RM1_2_2]
MKDATPLLTLWLPHPDCNEADLEREFNQYKTRQRAILDCADGLLDPSTLLDIIEATGIDPLAYVEEAEESIDALISHG